MHPMKLFSDCTIVENMIVPGGIKRLLTTAHPMNFLHNEINLPVYRISIHYLTEKGNLKQVDKYAVLQAPYNNPEYMEEWIDMFVEDYQAESGKKLRDWGLESIERLGTAVLRIG